MNKVIPNLDTKLSWSIPGFFVCYALIIALIALWNLTRAGGTLWIIWGSQCLPLLIFLPGLYKRYYRSYSWFCFLLLLYFVMAVAGALKSTAGAYDYLFLLLTTTLFILSMMSSRWLQYSLHQQSSS